MKQKSLNNHISARESKLESDTIILDAQNILFTEEEKRSGVKAQTDELGVLRLGRNSKLVVVHSDDERVKAGETIWVREGVWTKHDDLCYVDIDEILLIKPKP